MNNWKLQYSCMTRSISLNIPKLCDRQCRPFGSTPPSSPRVILFLIAHTKRRQVQGVLCCTASCGLCMSSIPCQAHNSQNTMNSQNFWRTEKWREPCATDIEIRNAKKVQVVVLKHQINWKTIYWLFIQHQAPKVFYSNLSNIKEPMHTKHGMVRCRCCHKVGFA